MWVALSVLVSLACVLASARRLSWAMAPIGIDPARLTQAVQGSSEAKAGLSSALEGATEDLSWERELFAALQTGEPGLVNEQILDLEWRAGRWARVPRVCASISTSAGFLFASMALIQGLSAGPLPDVSQAVSPALDALSVSIAGGAFCLAVHVRARRAVRDWLIAAERLVACLSGA